MDVRLATGERLGIEAFFGVLFFLHGCRCVDHGRDELHAYSGTFSGDDHDWRVGRDLWLARRIRRVAWRERNHDVPPAVPHQGKVFRVGHRLSDIGWSDSGNRRGGEFRAPWRIAIWLPLSEIPAGEGSDVFRFRKLLQLSQ